MDDRTSWEIAETLVGLLPEEADFRDIAETDIEGGEYESAVFVALEGLSEHKISVPSALLESAREICRRRWTGSPSMITLVEANIKKISS